MKLKKSVLMVATLASLTAGANAAVVFQDGFTTTGQDYSGGGPVYQSSLVGTAPTVGTGTWVGGNGGVDAGGWGQTGSGYATPTTSNYLAFTPDSALTYTLQMTVDTTPLQGSPGTYGVGSDFSWFAAAFTTSLHNWNGTDTATIDLDNLVRFNSNAVTTITYTVSGADLATAGVQYVGWMTDYAGGINLSNGQQVRISNFSLTAVPEPASVLLGVLGVVGLLRRRR